MVQMTRKEKKGELKKLRALKKEILKEMGLYKTRLHALKYDLIRCENRQLFLKEDLGKQKLKRCPSFPSDRPGKCPARRFFLPTWTRTELARTHCYCCKLTPKQVATAMVFRKLTPR